MTLPTPDDMLALGGLFDEASGPRPGAAPARKPARTTLPAMSEAAFQLQVTGLAQLLGWHWFHARPAQTAHGWRTAVSGPLGKGFPDLVMARPRDGRLVFAELKRDGGRLTPEQTAVMDVLRASGAECHVWRPADFDAIAEVLR